MAIDTIPALFLSQAERFGPRIALRFKKHGLYHDLRWSEYRDMISACAAALVQSGIEPGDRVAILAENSVEWLVADMAILSIGAADVPLHAPLSARQAHWQLENSGAKWIFVSNQAQLDKVQQIRGELPGLAGVVAFDERPPSPPTPLPQRGEGRNGAIGWSAFLQRGRLARAGLQGELARRQADLQPGDLATIIYTSGTTGNPKGVMLTQQNLLSNAQSFAQISPLGPWSLFFNWLPFSHIYARTVDIYVTIVVGATLSLAENADTVVANVKELRPTNLSAVPRFYEKVLTAVQDPDKAVVRKRLHDIFGDRVDFLGSGGAPLPPGVAQGYHEAGLIVLQGYGLTESSPVISFNRKHQNKIGSVGQPIPGVEVRIGPDGEVLTRGSHVMKGYWNNPEETERTIVDGWLHTGDLGELDADGFLHINGRKKDLLVLSNGKKVVPSHLESMLLADPCIDQAVICGEAKNFLVALVVPHWANLTAAMSVPEVHAGDPKVRAFLEKRIQAALKDMAAWEQVKKIVVLPQPFSAANDELTVSLKLRRNVILDHNRAALDGIYRE